MLSELDQALGTWNPDRLKQALEAAGPDEPLGVPAHVIAACEQHRLKIEEKRDELKGLVERECIKVDFDRREVFVPRELGPEPSIASAVWKSQAPRPR